MNTYGKTKCPECKEGNSLYRPVEELAKLPAFDETDCFNCGHKYKHSDIIKAMTTPRWRLYGRLADQKQFKPIDWSKGMQVTNLIYASIFTDAEKSNIERVDIPANPEWNFEFRTI